MEKGDVIIHPSGGKYQWGYCIEGGDENKTGFEAGNFKQILSENFFDTKESAIADLNVYIEKYRLEKPKSINIGL